MNCLIWLQLSAITRIVRIDITKTTGAMSGQLFIRK